MKARNLTFGLPVLALVCGCSFHARSPEDYKKVTRALLETRADQMQDCYESVLKDTPDASGTVVVSFTVEPSSGEVTNAKVTKDSTAPEPLAECVVRALDGLVLDPPDERQGDATFSWTFKKAE